MGKISIKENWKNNSIVDKEKYESMYKDSIENNERFWSKQGEMLNLVQRM